MKKYIDLGGSLVIALTFILFIAVFFATGFTHDLLLEAGVFLVSIKLIMMSYKNALSNQELVRKIDEILELLSRK